MNPRRLFVASCMSIGTAAMVFAIRGDVAVHFRMRGGYRAVHISDSRIPKLVMRTFARLTCLKTRKVPTRFAKSSGKTSKN